MNNKISSYSREELLDVLRVLKSYRSSLKQIGNRASIVDSRQKQEKVFRIEYAGMIDQDFLRNFSEKACEKFFPDIPTSVQKEYKSNEKIIGGIRIFYGDDMMDLSFQDYKHTLQ